jgi:hypothetical protein
MRFKKKRKERIKRNGKKEKKRENKMKQCRFEGALFLLLLPLDVQQRKRSFLFSSLCFFLSLPRALLEPKPGATCLMMRRMRSRAPQAMPSLATSHGVVID